MKRLLSIVPAGIFCAAAMFAAGSPKASGIAGSGAIHQPVSFERNEGQSSDVSAGWIGRVNGHRVELGATGATLLPQAANLKPMRMEFAGARRDASSSGVDPLPGKTSYFIGRDSSRWLRNLDTYGRVEYRDVYRGVDVVWYGKPGELEYDIILKPGSDPRRVRLRFEGCTIALESGGDARLESDSGSLELRAPVVYQEIGSVRSRVAARYVAVSAREIRLSLAHYDPSKPLVIDPTLVFGSYFGGGLSLAAMTTDSAGNVYIAGKASSGLPTDNSLQPGSLGNVDVWVAKLDPAGTELLYSTYIGGSLEDNILTQSSIAVDSAGELIVTGQTFSTDFPLVNPAQSQGPANPASYCLPFAFKLNNQGNALVYSTYLGGNPPDGASGWAVTADSSGNAYIAGEADGGFATTVGVYQSAYGGGYSDAFVSKLSPTGAIVFSTLIGGSGLDIASAIKSDPNGNVYIAGYTGSTSFPQNPHGANTTNAGGLDVFIAKLNSAGSALDWLTLLGGSGDDVPSALAIDSSGVLYVAGTTDSPNLPTTSGAFQPTSHGPKQGLVASVASNGMSYGFVTYLGGSRVDDISGLAYSSSGLVLGGSTTSTNFPVINAIQPNFTGSTSTLYATSNSGATWSAADTGLPNSVIGVAPDPSSPGSMMAASGSDFQWFQTVNRGSSWTELGSSSLYLYYHPAGAQLFASLADPSTFYAAYPYSVGLDNGGSLSHSTGFLAFRSVDSGVAWKALSQPPALSTDDLAGIAVSPSNANEIDEISAAGDVFQSTDGGANFVQISSLGSSTTWGFTSAVTGSPDGSIYVGACSVYKSSDFGVTWSSLYLGECIGNVAVSPSDPSIVYAVNAYGGVFDLYQSANAGMTWTQMTSPALTDAFGAVLTVAPSNPNVLYASSGNQIAVSTNGGLSWSTPVTMPASVSAIAVSAINPARAYAAAGTSVADGFTAKLSTSGTSLVWSTFYTGDSGAAVNAVVSAPATSAWIAGNSSPGLPLSVTPYNGNAYNGTAFLARIQDNTNAPCYYIVGPPAVLSYGAGTVNTTVTAPSGCAWTTATSESWISISSGASETASGIVTATVSANHGSSTRAGSITIAGKSFNIVQPASTCTYALSGNMTLPSSGGDLSIGVTTASGCPWKATSNSPEVSVVSGYSGTGSGTVTLSVAPNYNVSWSSPTVQIGPQILTIQEADICTYTLSPQTLSSGAASGFMTVTANPAGCSWSPTSNSSWLTVSGSGTGSGTFPYSVVANTTGEPRTANVTLDHQVFPVTQGP